MSEDEEQLKPLLLQKKAWSNLELLEHIIDRHFRRLRDEIGPFPSWQVTPIDGSVSESVAQLDEHLRNHGWRAMIDVGEPYVLTLIDLPDDRHPEQTPLVQTLFWVLATMFSLALGASWLAYQDSSVNWYDTAVLQSSAIYFCVPLMVVIGLTSVIRKNIFQRHGVDAGNFLVAISPIMFVSKSVIIWPFGLFFFMNQRFMQTVAWANRRGMLISGVVTPFCFIISGLIFSVVGILMTANNSVDFIGAPAILQLNSITHLIASLFITPEEIAVRTVWLHPLALAGQSLMTFGWILLLPIPGFPGYRLLWAVFGRETMTDSGTEFALYGLFLFAGVIILLTSGYIPWLIVISLGVWRMFSEQSITSAGLIVDEVTELDSRYGFRVFTSVAFALMLTFPGLAAVAPYENWEEGLALDWVEELDLQVDEEWSHTLDFEMVGISQRFVQVSVWADPPRPDWDLEIECGSGNVVLPTTCDIGNVDLLNDGKATLSASISNNSTMLLPTVLHFIVDADSERSVKTITLNPETAVSPIQAHWQLEPTFDGLLACANLTFSNQQITGNLSTPTLLWSVTTPTNGIFTSDSEPEICLSGPSHGRMVLESDDFGQILPLSFISDEGKEFEWPLRLQNPTYALPIPAEGWWLDGKSEQTPSWLTAGNHVAWGEGDEICTNIAREPGLVDGVLNWNVETRGEVIIPDVNGTNQMHFTPPIGGVVSACDDDMIPPLQANFTTASGPSLALRFGEEVTWAWVDQPLTSGEWELMNLGNTSIVIVTMSHHDLDDTDSGWVDSSGVTIPPGASMQLNLTQTFDSNDVLQVAWLSLHEESGITDSIRLNFGSWCYQGADIDHSDGQVECVISEG